MVWCLVKHRDFTSLLLWIWIPALFWKAYRYGCEHDGRGL